MRPPHAMGGALLLLAVLAPAGRARDEVAPAPALAPGQGGDWPIYRGDPALRGVAEGELPRQPVLRWTYEAASSIASSPVIAGDRVLCGADDSQLHCVALADGKQLWTFATGDLIEAPPLVAAGRAYVGSADGWFYAVNLADGTLAWKHETGDQILGSANRIPAAGDAPERIVVGSYDSSLYCFRADSGELLWTYVTGDRLNGSPAVADEQIVIGGCDTVLHVVCARTGTSLRQLPMGEACHIAASGALDGGRFYVGHYGNEFVCVDLAGGKIVWRYSHPTQAFFSAPAVTADAVLFGGRDKRLHCVDKATGTVRWTFPTGRKVDASPVVCGDAVVFCSGDGRVRILGLQDGAERWSHDIGQAIFSSPAVAGGMIVTGAGDGRLYAFGPARE